MGIKKVKRYLKIYWHLIKFAAVQETTYRFSFFMELIIEIFYIAFSLFLTRVFFWNIKEIGGWIFPQILIFQGVSVIFAETILGLAFIHNFRNLPGKIVNGELDLILTKPISSQFVVSLWRPYFAFIPSLIPGFLMIVYGFNASHLSFNPLLLLPFLVIFFSGLITAYSLGMIICTLSVWFINADPLPDLAENILFLAERPYGIFTGVWKVIFLVVFPLAFMITFPAQTLLGKFEWWWVAAAVLLAALFLKLSSVFWQFSLKHYQSASS